MCEVVARAARWNIRPPPHPNWHLINDQAPLAASTATTTHADPCSGTIRPVRIGLLGPLEVRDDDGTPVDVAGTRLRTLLTILALQPGQLISTTHLVDGIWGDEPPAGAANALQALVSRLRRALPTVTIESHPTGYRLAVDAEAVDVTRFERLVARGRRTPDDPAATSRTLQEALDLWRGSALLDVADLAYFQAPLAHLHEVRLSAIEERIDADLRLGRGADVVAELATLVTEHSLRERLVRHLMRALVSVGRPAEALTVYERTRELLADQLGADPSAELAALHAAILRGEVGSMPAATDKPAVLDAATASPRTNVRAGLTSFVGRDRDVAEVADLVGEFRLTTLIGPGGAGKTRLATEVARALLLLGPDDLPEGAYLVELASVDDGADIPSAVAAAIGLRDLALIARDSADDPLDRLVGALRSRAMLLVLDNCEHVIGAAASVADWLLGECPRLRILATSREPLGITGEAVRPVEPLRLPPPGAGNADLLTYDAVRLLVDRARAARPGLVFTDSELDSAWQICRALDGMPLAIELAAARLRTMDVEQLASRLDDRFRLLTGGSRTALPRQQTLRAVVDWSWDLLSDAERALLRRLAMFSGGATTEAAERVCTGGAVAGADVLGLLTALTDKSLLVAGTETTPRFRMLETIRAYCLERLDEAGEREAMRRSHGEYFAALVETAEPHLRRAEQLTWMARLALEHDNTVAAVRNAIAAADAQIALRVVTAAGWYWWLSGHRADGGELARAALAVPGLADDEVRATAYAVLAMIVTAGLGDERPVDAWIAAAQELSAGTERRSPLLRMIGPMGELLKSLREGGNPAATIEPLLSDEDPWVRAQARLNWARLIDPGGRRAEVEAALTEFRTIGERWGISYSLTVLADLAGRHGELAAAVDYYEQAIAIAIEIGATDDTVMMRGKQAQLRWLLGDKVGSAAALALAAAETESVVWPDGLAAFAFYKADVARWSGDFAAARVELARAETLLRQITVHPIFEAMMRDSLGYVNAADGDLDAAQVCRAEALGAVAGSYDGELIGQIIVGIADHAVRRGRFGDAVRLLAAASTVAGGLDRSRPDAGRVETAARAALGDAEFTQAMQRGAETFEALAAAGREATRAAILQLAEPVIGPVSSPATGPASAPADGRTASAPRRS